MITFDIKRMKEAISNVFNKKLQQCHSSLLNNPEYKDLLEEATILKTANGERIFNSHYITALAYISDEFTPNYLLTLLYENNDYANNVIGSEKLYWEIVKIGPETTLLEKLYIVARLNDIIHQEGTDSPSIHMDFYNNYIHIYNKIKTCMINYTHIGKLNIKDALPLGVSMTESQKVSFIIAQKENEDFQSSIIDGVIIMMDEKNREIHIVSADKFMYYSDDHPFLVVRPKWRVNDNE